jgi:PAS domain S-box-containing protein
LVLDVEGRIVRYNRHMEEITGVPFEEARAKDWFTTFIPEQERRDTQSLFASARGGAEVLGHVNPIRTATGELREILWYATRLLDREQQVVGVVSIGHDITEQRIAQRRLIELEHASRQSDRLADIGAITAKIVHDLGNPLAALTMQAQLILRRARRGDFQPSDVVAKPIDQMLETLERLQVLVREFTDFARERPLRILPIHLPEFLEGVTEMWDAYASARGVALRAQCGTDATELHADLEMLRRVLDNVIKNAVDAVDTMTGEVVVEASRLDAANVRISVLDDGCGVADGIDVFRLFETTKPDGTGIGLAVAKQIVLAHGGEISYERRKPRGTVFRIDIPIAGPSLI